MSWMTLQTKWIWHKLFLNSRINNNHHNIHSVTTITIHHQTQCKRSNFLQTSWWWNMSISWLPSWRNMIALHTAWWLHLISKYHQKTPRCTTYHDLTVHNWHLPLLSDSFRLLPLHCKPQRAALCYFSISIASALVTEGTFCELILLDAVLRFIYRWCVY